MLQPNRRRYFIRGRKGTLVYVSPEEYMFRFFHDAVERNGKIIGYVHNFYNDYVVVLHTLQTLCFKSTVIEGQLALLKFYNISN